MPEPNRVLAKKAIKRVPKVTEGDGKRGFDAIEEQPKNNGHTGDKLTPIGEKQNNNRSAIYPALHSESTKCQISMKSSTQSAVYETQQGSK